MVNKHNIQTVLFSASKWDEKSAKSWLKKHNLNTSKIVLEKNYYHARQQSAPISKKSGMNWYTVKLTKTVGTKKVDTGIRYVLFEK